MLLIDGVKYELWTPKKEVEEFHPLVKEHYKEIFGGSSIFIEGSRLESGSGKGSIPDGFVITPNEIPQWYIVEMELSTHQLYDHIVNQVGRFINGIKTTATQKKIIEAIYQHIQENKRRKAEFEEAIGSGEIFKFISDLVTKPPVLVVIIEDKTQELDEALDLLKYSPIKIVKFQTFRRVGAEAVHAHLFEPPFQISVPIASSITPPIQTLAPVVGGKKGERRVTVKDLIDADILKVGQVIYKVHKGQRFEGKVLNDGSIELAHNSKKFDALSEAATHITGTSMNGWVWWRTIRPNGTECLLDELRTEYKS